jgi:hypothetical protein
MYKILSIQDASRPRCRRFVAHVETDTNDKDKVKAIIYEATNEIQKAKDPAHVVRLYVHYEEKLICQSMWVNKLFLDAPLPKPLNYNDSIGDIGIVW